MAKRISSMFSLASNSTDRSSNESRLATAPSQSPRPSTSSRGPSPATFSQKSTPDLRPITPVPYSPDDIRNGSTLTPQQYAPQQYTPQQYTPQHSPYLGASLSPTLEDNGALLEPPQSLQPLPERPNSTPGSRPGSRPRSRAGRPVSRASNDNLAASRGGSRPTSPAKHRPLTPTTESKLNKRRSWLPGGRSRSASQGGSEDVGVGQAWIKTPQEKIHYDIHPLIGFHKVPELWNENGDTQVYLHTRQDGKGPSFKVDSSIFVASRKLTYAAHGGKQHQERPRRLSSDWQPRLHVELPGDSIPPRRSSEMLQPSFTEHVQSLTLTAPTPMSPPASYSSNRSSSRGNLSPSDYFGDDSFKKDEIQLCVPQNLQANLASPGARLTSDDVETLVAVRNLFAFLSGQPLVATSRHPSSFSIFLRIADMLQRYHFTNLYGSTLGEDVVTMFSRYVIDFKLADVRASREKTIEAMVLGERMKSVDLYNEGFVHAVGKYEDIAGSGIPKLYQISETSRKRLERASLDLSTRLRNIRTRLDDFDFPSLFSGIANSSTSSESKVIRFKNWKSAFASMRRHVTRLYKHRFGAWPPKAKSKKNAFEESGLNRLLLKEVYQDFSDLYDVLVDRQSLTTRSADIPSEDGPDDPQEPTPRALRRVMSEYDRSTPPVQPPVPFDTPLIPSLHSTRRNFEKLDLKKQRKESTKKLQDSEINTALMQSYNRDSMHASPFLEAFFAFERRSAHGKSIEEIADLRNGQWIFMYAVLQALPLLVVDAPGLHFTRGVEYFLCEVPPSNPPWGAEVSTMHTYRIAAGGGMVTLPAAIVEHGVDGIYRRSHCWEVAEKWSGNTTAGLPGIPQWEVPYEQLLPPTMPSAPGSRNQSRNPDRRASMALGLEQLPLPMGVKPAQTRPISIHDPSKNFNAILGLSDGPEKAKKK